jgi:hypothetical protein
MNVLTKSFSSEAEEIKNGEGEDTTDEDKDESGN